MTWSSGACRTAEDRRRQRWRKVRVQVHPQPPSSPGLRGLLFKPSFHFPSYGCEPVLCMQLRSKGPASKPACFRDPRATTWIPHH